jgi:hypothetical protein
MGRIVALLTALGGALIWAWFAILPPPPQGADAPPASFSATRAFADIEAIARAPHPTGSTENAEVRRYLAQRMLSLGAEVSQQAFPLSEQSVERLGKWRGREESSVIGHNLIGVFPGTDRGKPSLLLMAHHDSVWGSPGAGDDAMAMAAALEVARALKVRGKPQRDLILLFTDSEEIGLDGAKAYFGAHPDADRTGIIINMEARGSGGRANMFETGSGNGEQMRLYAETVARPASHSLAVLIYDLMPNATDYTIAKERGIAGYNIAVLDRAWSYHSPLATPASVDPASLQDMGDQTLALASALAFAPELPERTANAAFGDLLGRVTIVYPPAAGWAILLIAAGLIAAALWRRPLSARTIGQGAILTIAMLLHGALLLTAFNAVSGSGDANYYDRLAAIPRLEIIAALLVAALLTLLGELRRPERRLVTIMVAMALMWIGLLSGGSIAVTIVIVIAAMGISALLKPATEDRGEAATLLLLLAATIVQAMQPTAGPILQWPLLLASVAIAARAFLPATAGLAITAIAASIGLGHLLAHAHFIFLAIGPELPAALMVILFAAWPLIQPLWPDRVPSWMPGLALAAALALTLWVRLDPLAPSVPEYSLTSPGKTKD